MNKFWTDELAQAVKTLWQEGLTGSQIARAMDLGRNSVLGKLHRMGLLGFRKSKQPNKNAAAYRINTRRARRSLRPPPILLPEGAAQQSFNGDCGPIYDIMELRLHHCRWPLGDPTQPGFAYCGAHTEKGPYCEAHSEIAHVEPFYRIR